MGKAAKLSLKFTAYQSSGNIVAPVCGHETSQATDIRFEDGNADRNIEVEMEFEVIATADVLVIETHDEHRVETIHDR